MKTPESLSRAPEKVSNSRLIKSIELMMLGQNAIREKNVEGFDNLEKLSPNEAVIIATSHSTGYDFPLIINALGKKLDFVVADQSTHHEPDHEIASYLSQKIAGSNNFVPVSYSWHGDVKSPDPFNPKDAEPMVEALNNGRSVMVAAHNPLIVEANGESRPPKTGYLAGYLASLSGHRVLPIGVDYEPVKDSKKYDATVHIGEPFMPQNLTDAQEISELFDKRKNGEKLTSEEISEFHEELNHLRSDSTTIFDRVQSLQRLELGYPVLDKAYTEVKLGEKATEQGIKL